MKIKTRQFLLLGMLMSMLVISLNPTLFRPVAAEGEDDEYEENDDWDQAALLTEGTYTGLKLLDTDGTDYFKIVVPSMQMVKVVGSQDSPYSNWVYLDLATYEEDYNYYEYEDGTSFYSEESDVMYFNPFQDDMTVFIKVNSWLFSGEITYNLELDLIDPVVDAYYEYGIAAGDDLDFTSTATFDFEASSEFYDEVETVMVAELEAEYGDDIFADDFDLEAMIADVEAIIGEPINIRFLIQELYGLNLEDFDEDMAEYLEVLDVIQGDVRFETTDGYDLPPMWLSERAEGAAATMEGYFDADFWTDMGVEDGLDDFQDELANASEEDFNDLLLASHIKTTEPIADIAEDEGIELANGTTIPAPPMEYYMPGVITGMLFNDMGPGTTPMCFPTDFSMQDYWLWAQDLAEWFAIYYEEETGEEMPDMQLDDLLTAIGVTSFVVGDQGIGFSWSFDEIDYDSLQDWIEIVLNETLTEDIDEMVEDAFDEIPLEYATFTGDYAIALEYDSDMVLASYAMYVNFEGVIDLTGFDVPAEFPDIDGEAISISISETFVRDGYSAPSQDQIIDGEIAENRSMGGGILSDIPGYPVWFMGFFGVISIIAIYVKAKKH